MAATDPQLLLGTATATAPLTVRLDGAATSSPASRLSSYAPTVSDRVLVARYGTTIVVLGKLV